MKWENIYTTLTEGDGGSAFLSPLVPRGYRTTPEETRKRLEKIQQKDKIPQTREPQLHTFREAEVAWTITEWDTLPACLSQG